MRHGAGVLLLVASVLALGAGPPAAGRAAPAPRIRVLDTGVGSVLARGAARGSVRPRRGGPYRLFATVLPATRRGAPVVVTPVVAVRLRAGRAGTVSLRLLPAG